MPSQQLLLEQIEVNVLTGQLFVQWRKQITADNGAIVFAEPHRTSLEPAHYMPDGVTLIPATDRAAQIAAVDAHLTAMGWPTTSPQDKAAIASHDTARLTIVPMKGVPSV